MSNEGSFEHQYAQRRTELRDAIDKEILTLLRNGTSLQDVARLISAGESFTEVNGVADLNVQAYADRVFEEQARVKLPRSYVHLPETILPPGFNRLQTGDGEFVEHGLVNNRENLVIVLDELGQEYDMVDGENAPDMMRLLSYEIYFIPGLKKAVMVNGQKGETTYIIHHIDTQVIDWKRFGQMKKQELRDWPDNLVTKVLYTSDADQWKARVRDQLLFDPIPKAKAEIDKTLLEKAPDGWMTNKTLAKSLGASPGAVKKIADQYRGKAEYEHYFHDYLDSKNRKQEHYHPDLVMIITKAIELRAKEAPDNWRTKSVLAAALGISYDTLDEIIARYRLHPNAKQWFKNFRNRNGTEDEYMAPVLVAILVNEVDKRGRPAPPGWYTIKSLADELRVSTSRLNNIVDYFLTPELRNKHYIRQFLDEKNRKIDYLHPHLARIVKESIVKQEGAPAGWRTRGSLSHELGVKNWREIDYFVDQYRETNKEWFKDYYGKKGRFLENFHPDLVALIKEKFKNTEPEEKS